MVGRAKLLTRPASRPPAALTKRGWIRTCYKGELGSAVEDLETMELHISKYLVGKYLLRNVEYY